MSMTMRSVLFCMALLLWGTGCRVPQANSSTLAVGNQTAVQDSAATEQRSARPRRARREDNAQPGQFDFYLLTLSWSPEYCLSHPADAQCTTSTGFVLHGLWPENSNGTYPERCSDAPGPSDPSAYADIYPDAGLLQHEWSTHGTCSGLQPDAFLALERKALYSVKIPADLSGKSTPARQTPAELLSNFAQVNNLPVTDFALSCGNNRLTAVNVCLDKTLHPLSCAGVHSCGATVVQITPYGVR